MATVCAAVSPRLLDVLDAEIGGADDSPAIEAERIAGWYFKPPPGNGSHGNGTAGNATNGTHRPTHSILNPDCSLIYVEGKHDLISDPAQLLGRVTNRTSHRYPNRTNGYLLLPKEPELAQVFVSPDRQASFLSVFPAYGLGQDLLDFAAELRRDPLFASLWIGATGEDVVTQEASSAAGEDMGRCDLLVLPVALVVLGWVLASWRLLLIPVINFAVSSVIAFASVYFLVLWFDVHVTILAPALMSTMLLAVAVDYSLFLLSRLVEETARGLPLEEAVEKSLSTSGHTILGSGSTLVVCFGALAMFPVPVLKSLGYATMLSILAAMAASLCLTPALLLAAPRLLRPPSCCCRPGSGRSEAALGASWGYRLARAATHPLATGAALTLLVLGALLLWPLASELKSQGELTQLLPTSSLSMQTINHALDKFPKGIVQPYFVLLLPAATKRSSAHGTIFNASFWSESHDALRRVAGLFPARGASSILSPMFLFGAGNFPLHLLKTSLQVDLFHVCHESLNLSAWHWPGVPCQGSDKCCAPGQDCCVKAFLSATVQARLQGLGLNVSQRELLAAAASVRGVLRETVNANGTAVRALLVADVAPGSAEGCDFVRDARTALTGLGDGSEAFLGGGDGPFLDVIDAVVGSTPRIMLVTSAVVLLLVGLLYRSVAIPVRAVATIGSTVLTALAVVVAVYQHGALRALGGPFTPAEGVICVLPPLALSVVLGLALDYDVFLVGRIVELRDLGLADREAITVGLWRSGRVVTAAGLVMAIAFSGLVMSRIPALNMLGTLLVAAVLLDTFVMRALVTPALMAPLGRLNWFPRKVVEPRVVDLDCGVSDLPSAPLCD